jgi:hypothetical protein
MSGDLPTPWIDICGGAFNHGSCHLGIMCKQLVARRASKFSAQRLEILTGVGTLV